MKASEGVLLLSQLRQRFPDINKVTIMSGTTVPTDTVAYNVGIIDQRAMEETLQLFKQKYGEHYQPKPTPEPDAATTTKWREINKPVDQKTRSSDGTLSR